MSKIHFLIWYPGTKEMYKSVIPETRFIWLMDGNGLNVLESHYTYRVREMGLYNQKGHLR